MPGLYTFGPGAQGPGTASDIQVLESDLERLKKLAESMQEYAPLGSDDALEAGFDPSNPTKVDQLAKRIESLAKQRREVEKDVDQAHAAFVQLQEARTMAAGQLPDDEADRRQACVKVVRLLVNSPTKFHTLLRGLGVELTEEIKDALDNSLRGGFSDSQADQWLHGTEEDQRRMRITTQELETKVQSLEEDIRTERHTVERLYSERQDARDSAKEYMHALNKAERESTRLRQDRDRLRREARANEDTMEADMLSMRELRDERLKLTQQISDLAQEKSDASARADEAQGKLHEQAAELSLLRTDVATFRLNQPRVQNHEATIQALRLAVANATEDAVGSGQRLATLREYNLDFRAENRSLSRENERLERELAQALQRVGSLERDNLKLSHQKRDLEQQVSAACDLTAVLTNHTAELTDRTAMLTDRTVELRGEKEELEQQTSSSRDTSNAEKARILQDLESAAARADEAERSRDELQEALGEQRRTLANQVGEITRLTESSQERENSFSRQSEAQVQQAATLLRFLSIDTESDIWQSLAKRTLQDLTWLAVQTTWHPWKIVSSWSTNEALDVQVDGCSAHAAGLDVLAILRSGSADVKNLLSRLQVLQKGLIDSPSVISSMAEMLLESFAEGVQDTRLHLMHRLAMWQVALKMFPISHVQATLGEALDKVDTRIVYLATVMRSWDSDDPTEFDSTLCVTYPEMALLGFCRNPPGVMAFSRRLREICWVDIDRIHQNLDEMEVTPLTGTAIYLPLDNEERLAWALTHA